MEKKLYRTKKDKVIGGVCSGLGEFFNIDPVWIRLIYIVSFFYLAAFPLLLYVILWIMLPENPEEPAAAVPVEGEEAKPAKKTGGIVISVIFAAALILAGVFFLFPHSLIAFKDVIQICISLFLIAAAVKLFYEVVTAKNYSFILVSMGFVLTTLGLFLFLNSVRVLGYGVLWTYTKFLFPTALIIGGFALIVNSLKERTETAKLVGASATAALLIFLAIYAVVKSKDDRTFTLFDRIACPFLGENWFSNIRGFGESDYSFTIPSGADHVIYDIRNRAGSLKIDSGEELGFHCSGTMPGYSTNYTARVFDLTFDNKASDTALTLSEALPATMDVELNAGEIKADLTEVNIGDLKVVVTAGNGVFEIGDSVRDLNVDLMAGSARIKLPSNLDVVIYSSTTFGDLRLPPEFAFRDGAYRYDGPGSQTLEAHVSVLAGDLRFMFE